MGFTPLDYGILVAYLAATAIFGSLLGRSHRDTRDYFFGGKHMSWWAISLSIVATETSTLTFIGVPAIAYTGNLAFLQLTFGYLLGKLLVSFILIPGYFRGDYQTAYELLQQQFGQSVRRVSALLFQITRTLADGVRLFATALVLSVVTRISDLWTVVIIGAVTVFYTFFGGMTAVVWTDVIQLAIYLTGAVLALFVVLDRIPGGWQEAMAVAGEHDKLGLLNFNLDFSEPYTFLAGLVGGAFLTFSTHGTDQLMVQRYLACGDRWKSQAALIASGVIIILQMALFLVIGVLLFVFYRHFPDRVDLSHIDRVFPTFIVQEMPAGVSGLIIAAIFAAAMSTLSGSLNSLASSAVNDFYRPLRPDAGETHYLRVSRWVTLGWGVLLVLVSMLARSWGEVLEVGLTIQSFTMGSVLGIFLLGTFRRRVSQPAGLIGMAVGMAAMLVVGSLEAVAWTWYALIGSAATVAAGLAAGRLWDGQGGPSKG
ncbi:MAG: sodium:solute symporter [Acidobacteriota bacterium]